MPKTKAIGTTLSYLPTYDSVAAVKLIGALTSIGEIAPSAGEIDVTTLDSAAGFKEFIQGERDSGDVTLNGFHVLEDVGQVQARTSFGTGTAGYFWVTFPDNTVVAFMAIVTGYRAGAPNVNGAVVFGATFRIVGIVQVICPKLAVAQSKSDGETATLDSTATALKGTPTYQWYSNDSNDYLTPTIVAGATSATYTTPALTPAGTYYYFCVITVSGWRPINSQIHAITVT